MRELFARGDMILEKVEELYIHLFGLADENEKLRERITDLEKAARA